jgi:hypothetical protein
MRLIHAFTDISMSNGHDGLAEILRKRAKIAKLTDGCAVFINRSWTAMKLLVPGDTLLHLRRPKNRPIDPAIIKYLPACIEGAELNYGKALETMLVKDYNVKRGIEQ